MSKTEKRHAGETAKTGGACATAGVVRLICAANAAISVAGCAYALALGTFAPSLGLALALVVSVYMVREM